MRILLALIISFQCITAPFAAELGEKGEATMKVVMTEKLSRVVAEDFETKVRSSLKDYSCPDSSRRGRLSGSVDQERL